MSEALLQRELGLAEYEPTLQAMKDLTDSRAPGDPDQLWPAIRRSGFPVAFAVSSISSAKEIDSATRPTHIVFALKPQRMGINASLRPSDFASPSARCKLFQTSGAAQPLSVIHAVPREASSASSLTSRSAEAGRVLTSSNPLFKCEIASVSAIRFNANSPALCQSGIAASVRPAAVR